MTAENRLGELPHVFAWTLRTNAPLLENSFEWFDLIDYLRPQLEQIITPAFIGHVRSIDGLTKISETDEITKFSKQYEARDSILKKVFGEDVLDGFDTTSKKGKNDQKRMRQILTAAVAAAQVGDRDLFVVRLRSRIIKGIQKSTDGLEVTYDERTMSLQPAHFEAAIDKILNFSM